MAELAPLERQERSPYTYNRRDVVTTLVPSVLVESSPFLQITRTTIKSLNEFEFWQDPITDCELAVLERQKK